MNTTNSSFSKILPSLQIAWDSVSRGALQTCPRYYYYNIICGYTTKEENIHFTFGIGIHAAQETYHREKFKGKTHEESLNSAVRFAIEYTWDFKRRRPWISYDQNKNRETLIRTVVWYLTQFENDALKTFVKDDGSPAVELSFHFNSNLTTSFGEPYFFCGHIDRFVTWDEDFYITDIKTTKYSLTKSTQEFFNKYSTDDQMSGYYFAGKVTFAKPIKGLIIDAMQIAQNFSRFQRGETMRSPAQLDEWYEDTRYWLNLAEKFAQDNYWPMNKKSCNNFGGCPYLPVCGESPPFRPKILQDFYTQRIWDPLVTREV